MIAFWEGMVAGYGIAIPVGAIAILIIETGITGGLRPGMWAAAGAASADFLYALVAAVAGGIIATLLAPYATALQGISAAVLLGIGGYGIWRLRPGVEPLKRDESSGGEVEKRIYSKFLGLTLLNPLTVAYFAALILGGSMGELESTGGKLLFVAGAGLASLSWQLTLAGLGALGHHYFSPRVQWVTGLMGNGIVLLFGMRILLDLARGH